MKDNSVIIETIGLKKHYKGHAIKALDGVDLQLKRGEVVVIIGPSGSGKNEVAQALLKRSDKFEKLISYTTDASVAARPDGSYHYVSAEEFRRMCDSGELFESTMYAHHSYGSKKADVERILSQGKHVLTVMDICGAMSLKTLFPHVVTIFVKRDRRELIKDILKKDSTIEDKANRLLSIEVEMRNTQICDYTVKFDYCDQAVDQICHKLQV